MCGSEAKENSVFYQRVPSRVLGCLRSGEITVILFPGHGVVLEEVLQASAIPEDLRMPNSEFDILFEHPGAKIVGILPSGKGKECS